MVHDKKLQHLTIAQTKFRRQIFICRNMTLILTNGFSLSLSCPLGKPKEHSDQGFGVLMEELLEPVKKATLCQQMGAIKSGLALKPGWVNPTCYQPPLALFWQMWTRTEEMVVTVGFLSLGMLEVNSTLLMTTGLMLRFQRPCAKGVKPFFYI